MAKNKGHDNLIPISERSEEERRAIASKGGKAKAEKERQRKLVADTFNAILELELGHSQIVELEHNYHTGESMQLDLEGQTLLTHMCAEIVRDAIKGRTRERYRAIDIILKYIAPTD